ncbi:MAG: hypothetical protein ACTSWY_16015 [Promethearchaeota archaeon]
MAQYTSTSSDYITLHADNVEENSPNYDFSYKVTNIVALGLLKLREITEIDFTKIEKIIKVRYLNRFPCILFKIDGVSIIFFKNGKMIITGLKKTEQIPLIKKRIEKILSKTKIKYDDFSIEIQNFVTMTNLNRRINLEMTCLSMMNCIYEPEQFPAAIVRDYDLGGAFLIFSNSKIICLGIRNVVDLENSLKKLIHQIHEFGLIY